MHMHVCTGVELTRDVGGPSGRKQSKGADNASEGKRNRAKKQEPGQQEENPLNLGEPHMPLAHVCLHLLLFIRSLSPSQLKQDL